MQPRMLVRLPLGGWVGECVGNLTARFSCSVLQEENKEYAFLFYNTPERHKISTSTTSEDAEVPSNTMEWMDVKISSEIDWDMHYTWAHDESLSWNLPMAEHFTGWTKLISTAHQYKPNAEEEVLRCIKEMVETIPLRTIWVPEDGHNNWRRYIELAYDLQDKGLINSLQFLTMLRGLETKLSLSYNKAGAFWQTVRRCDSMSFEKEEKIYTVKCLDTFKKQFSTPYVDIKKDIIELETFVKRFSLDTNVTDIVSPQQLETLSNEAKSYFNCFETNNHHVSFEQWIENLLKKPTSQAKRAEVLCEETIFDEKYSVCYHFVLAKTLNSDKMSNVYQPDEIVDKLFKALKRGIKMGTEGCEDMLYYYLEYALNVAAKHFSVLQCKDLFDNIVESHKYEDSPSRFFASRKALVFGLKALIENDKMEMPEYEKKACEMLVPISDDGLKSGIILDNYGPSDYELRCVELRRFLFSCLRNLTNEPWTETLAKWESGLSTLKDPHSLVAFVAYVRENGSSLDIERAYLKAIELIEKIVESPTEGKYGSRKCLFLLLQNLKEFVAINGGEITPVEILSKQSKLQPKYSALYTERYFLNHHLEIYDHHMAYFVSLTDDTNQELNDSPTPEIPLEEMEQLAVKPKEKTSFPVFVSNIHYKATKRDISMAFKKKGLNVVSIKMGISHITHRNCGFARVDFSTEREANEAIENHTIKILKRAARVSVCKEKGENKSNVPVEKQVVSFNVSGLTEEFRNPETLSKLLIPFGHIKTIYFQESSQSMRIEYHMAEDAVVAITKLEDKFGKSIKITRSDGSPHKTNEQFIEKDDGHRELADEIPGPSGLKKQQTPEKSISKKRRLLVPHLLRKTMKEKLDLSMSSTITIGSGESTSPETQDFSVISVSSQDTDGGAPKEKRRRMMSPPAKGSMTNEDFKKLFKK